MVPHAGRGEGGLARFLLPVVALWVVPVLVVGVAIPLALWRETAATEDMPPRIVVAGSIVNDGTTPVEVELASPTTTSMTSRFGGIVTAVYLQTGSQVGVGETLLAVSDVVLRAQVGPSPIVSDVDAYSQGADVQRVGMLLAQVGLFDANAVTDTYTWSLRQAIDAWNSEANLPEDGVFRVASTVFVGDGQSPLSAVLVRVGDNLSEGAPVAEFAQQISGVRFAPAAEGTLAGLASGPVVFETMGRTIELGGLTLTPDEVSEFSAFLRAAAADGLLQASATGDSETLLGGTLSLADPPESATVPNSALFIGDDGDLCIFKPDEGSSQGSATPVPVPEALPLSGAAGLTAIDPKYVGDRIIANAGQVSMEARQRCG